MAFSKQELEILKLNDEEKSKKLELLKDKNSTLDQTIQGLETNLRKQEDEVSKLMTVVREYQETIQRYKLKETQDPKRK